MARLTGKQRRYLRGLGNALQPVIQIGKGALSEALLREIGRALDTHELIKIRVLESHEADTRSAAAELASRADAELVQTIGRTALLFRRNEEKPRLELPAASED